MGNTKAELFTRDVLWCRGPDSATFLQGQLTQDVAGLKVGGFAWSLLLQPQGKVVALMGVARISETEFLLDTASGFGEPAANRLSRFKLRTDCELELVPLGICVRREVADTENHQSMLDLLAEDLVGLAPLSVRATGWPGAQVIEAVCAPDTSLLDGVRAPSAALERVRILAGVPECGSELTEDTIPAEAGAWLIAATVSFTKGCYVGQELVARVDSRGSNTPRKLRRVTAADDVELVVGAPLTDADGAIVGAITSAASAVGLAFISRRVEVPAVLNCSGSPIQADPL